MVFTRLRVYTALLARAVMPAILKFYYAYLRNQQTVVDSIRHQLFPTIVAFLVNSLSRSLASVQRGITYPLTKHITHQESSLPIENNNSNIANNIPEKSVECQVLSQPEEEILADVIFIHGLHGGIDRTWKQGRWANNRHIRKHQSPVRSHSTGDLNILPQNQSLKRTISEIYSNPHKNIKNENTQISEEDFQINTRNENGESNYSDCWPQDWLPMDCPGVRVIALNYTTDTLWRPVWVKKRIRTDMVERSDEMIEELVRLGVGKKPIIWVGHSKGGLFIKQIIVNALEKHHHRTEVYNISNQSKAIMFYSVPHRGSSLADFNLPLVRRSVELIEIQRNCDFVLDLHKRFLRICKDEGFNAEIFSFIETSFTLMSFIYLKIVAYDSADPGIGIKCGVPLDHREICKPAGRDCFLYVELVKLIKKYLANDT